MPLVILLLAFYWPVNAEAVQSTPDTDDRLAALHQVLAPVFGADNYRLQLQAPAVGEARGRLVLLLNSNAPSLQRISDDKIRELVAWSVVDSVEPELVLVSRLPFLESNAPLHWLAEYQSYLWWLLVLPAFALLLWRREQFEAWMTEQLSRLPLIRRASAVASENDFQGDLAVLRQMAIDDPARVAQVFKQWISDEQR